MYRGMDEAHKNRHFMGVFDGFEVDFMKCATFRLLLAGLGLVASPAASSSWEVGMMSETIFFI